MDFEPDLLFPREKIGRDSSVRNMYDKGKVIDQLADDSGVFVRCQLLDKDGLVTRWLPVKQFGSRSTGSYWCPEIGDDVNVQFLPNSETGEGIVDGSFYNTGNPPPYEDVNTRAIRWKDGTSVKYNQEDHTMTIDTKGPINLETTGPVSMKAETITIKAGTIKLEGKVEIEGDIGHEGNMNTSGTHVDSNGVHC